MGEECGSVEVMGARRRVGNAVVDGGEFEWGALRVDKNEVVTPFLE